MADIMLVKPAAGGQPIIQSAEDTRIRLDFASGDALLERNGNDLSSVLKTAPALP